eukprot:scaffold1263_cov170-Ochromonas_danica.AAC.13
MDRWSEVLMTAILLGGLTVGSLLNRRQTKRRSMVTHACPTLSQISGFRDFPSCGFPRNSKQKEFSVQHHMTTIQLDEEDEENKRPRVETPAHTSNVSSPSNDLECSSVSEDANGSKLSPSRSFSPSHPTPPIELSSEKVESTVTDELDKSAVSITEEKTLAHRKELEQ